ncbi:MAG: hypothetical protein LUD02_15140 [Tannerellaceae bacterium]|nr:hypothetical protein [Tannerellaceae bacterium]
MPRIRIGIVGENNNLTDIPDEQLLDDVFIWILTNKIVKTSEFFPSNSKKVAKIRAGEIQVPKDEIIRENTERVLKNPIRFKNDSKHIFISNTFWVPRGEKENGDFTHMGVDYSFLRYAALKLYEISQSQIKFPPLLGGMPVETIDSDLGGIAGENIGELNNYNSKTLAYAGIYDWNSEEIKDDSRIQNLIPKAVERHEALRQFSEKYLSEEINARGTAASSHILNLYFPEPATRLTPTAITLLNGANFGSSTHYLNQPLGHARESIKLIAALAFLNSKKYCETKELGKEKLSEIAKEKKDFRFSLSF